MTVDSEWTNQPVITPLVIVAGTGTSGVFVYDPTAAAGNLIASMTDATADPFGNVTVKGVASYVLFSGDKFAVALNQVGPGGLPGATVLDTASVPLTAAGMYAASAASGTAQALLYSGRVAGGDIAAGVTLHSATDSGTTGGTAAIAAGLTTISGQLTATGGTVINPTLVTTDAWNSISPGGSWTASGSGVNGFFYRLLSTGDVLLAWDVNNNSATPGTLGTLPAAYRPATAVRLQSGWTGTGPGAYNNAFAPALQVAANGNITGLGLFVATLTMFGTAVLPLGSL